MSFRILNFLSLYLAFCSVVFSFNLSVNLSLYASIYKSTYRSIYFPSIFLSLYLTFHTFIFLSMSLPLVMYSACSRLDWQVVFSRLHSPLPFPPLFSPPLPFILPPFPLPFSLPLSALHPLSLLFYLPLSPFKLPIYSPLPQIFLSLTCPPLFSFPPSIQPTPHPLSFEANPFSLSSKTTSSRPPP